MHKSKHKDTKVFDKTCKIERNIWRLGIFAYFVPKVRKTGTPQIACDVPSIKENLIVKIEIS